MPPLVAPRLALLALLLSGCFFSEFDPPVPLYLGEYEVGDDVVGWYFYSLISSVTTPVIVRQDSTGTPIDTIAVSDAVYDVEVRGDTLILHSCDAVEVHEVGELSVSVDLQMETPCEGARERGRGWYDGARMVSPEARAE